MAKSRGKAKAKATDEDNIDDWGSKGGAGKRCDGDNEGDSEEEDGEDGKGSEE